MAKDTWNCNVCHAENSEIDGTCQYCECLGALCKRDNCDDIEHGRPAQPAYRRVSIAKTKNTMPKKFGVDTLKERVNHFLEHSPDSERAARAALASLLSGILHDCKAYRGFSYLVSKYPSIQGRDLFLPMITDPQARACVTLDDTRRRYN